MNRVKMSFAVVGGLAGLIFLAYAIDLLQPGEAIAQQAQFQRGENMDQSVVNGSPFACNTGIYSTAVRAHKEALNDQFVALAQEYRELPDGYAFRFPADTKSFQTIAEWVDLERACCPFFSFNLEMEREGGPLWLRLRGREGVKPFIKSEFQRVIKRLPSQAGAN